MRRSISGELAACVPGLTKCPAVQPCPTCDEYDLQRSLPGYRKACRLIRRERQRQMLADRWIAKAIEAGRGLPALAKALGRPRWEYVDLGALPAPTGGDFSGIARTFAPSPNFSDMRLPTVADVLGIKEPRP